MTDHARIAASCERAADHNLAKNLNKTLRRGGGPSGIAAVAAGQALLAISHRLADLTEAVRASGAVDR